MKNQQTTTGQQRSTAGKVRDKVGDAKDQVQETASHVASEARDKGEHLVEEGREKAHELGDKAGVMARSRAEQEKQRVTSGIRTFADALRRGSADLTGERDQFRPLLDGAADRVERLSGYLESRDVDVLANDVRRFAREHTPLFVGGAFALGFLGARFLKSTGDRAAGQRYADAERFDRYEPEDRFDRILPESATLDDRTTPGSFDTASRSHDASDNVRGGGYE